jgi:DNA helicase-2/ATP-dependent DNA helicase PcrA
MRSIGDREEMEEERRLCYVAITRAKQTLTISHARQRMLYGRTAAAMPSRFLRELPEEEIVKKGMTAPRSSYLEGGFGNWTPPAQNYIKKTIPTNYSTAVSTAQKASYLELNKGDMIQHAAFGRGMVLSVMKMGGDALLEIAFDQIGTKKLMAKTASAHMKKL